MYTGTGTTRRYTELFMGDVPWLWICDDYESSHDALEKTIRAHIETNPIHDVVISSQIKVGTTRRLMETYPDRDFVYIPENFRVIDGPPIRPTFTIIGTDGLETSRNFWGNIQMTTPENAELWKHAMNTYLAIQIAFSKVLEGISKAPMDLAELLALDYRIGGGAYIRPGGEPSAHILREVANMKALTDLPLIQCLP